MTNHSNNWIDLDPGPLGKLSQHVPQLTVNGCVRACVHACASSIFGKSRRVSSPGQRCLCRKIHLRVSRSHLERVTARGWPVRVERYTIHHATCAQHAHNVHPGHRLTSDHDAHTHTLSLSQLGAGTGSTLYSTHQKHGEKLSTADHNYNIGGAGVKKKTLYYLLYTQAGECKAPVTAIQIEEGGNEGYACLIHDHFKVNSVW